MIILIELIVATLLVAWFVLLDMLRIEPLARRSQIKQLSLCEK